MSTDAQGGDPQDARLVAQVRAGDQRAYETLVRKYVRDCFAVALGVTGQRLDAEDVCQDAWVRVLERIGDLREPARFRAWLLQIVRNAARNHVARRVSRQGESLDQGAVQDRRDPGQDLVVVLWRLRLERALAALSGIQREIVLLHDLEGWRHGAIARHLGISEVMSRQHLFLARRRLRALLGEWTDQEERHAG